MVYVFAFLLTLATGGYILADHLYEMKIKEEQAWKQADRACHWTVYYGEWRKCMAAQGFPNR